MMGFPLNGPQPRVAEFLRTVSTAFEIMAIILEMDKASQEEIMIWLQQKKAQRLKGDRNDG